MFYARFSVGVLRISLSPGIPCDITMVWFLPVGIPFNLYWNATYFVTFSLIIRELYALISETKETICFDYFVVISATIFNVCLLW